MEMGQIKQTIQNVELYAYPEKIDKIAGTMAESMGPACRLGDVCTIDVVGGGSPVMAEVVGFRENRVLLMPYEEMEGVGYGSAVRNTGERFHIAVSNQLIGRAVDAMGMSIDGLGPVGDVSYYTITGKPSNPMMRSRIDIIIQMGVKAIDGLLTVGRGQRMGVLARSDAGKSTLMGMIAKNTEADVNVIALVGERSREVVEFTSRDLGEEGLKRSVLVVVTPNQLAMMRSKCTMTTTTIAKHFKDQDMDVLLMMDSLTRFAMTQREVGLSIGEPSVASGCTPFIYLELPKPLECSGNFEEGSITGIYTVLAEGDDANEPIPDTVRGIIDGHTMLSRKVTAKNRYPAIDIPSSTNRPMNDIVMPERGEAAGKLRRLLAVYESNSNLVPIGVYKKGTNPELDDALAHIDRIYGFLQQKTDESFSLDEAVIRMTQTTN